MTLLSGVQADGLRMGADSAIASDDALVSPALVERVYERLQGMLLRLEVTPGARIAIDVLARNFGISQTPIREALSRLEAEGFVTRQPNRGYRAALELTARQVDDIFELKLLVEPHAAGRAAALMTDEARARAATMVEDIRRLRAAGPQAVYQSFIGIDAAFRRMITQGCGNARIADMLDRMNGQIYLFQHLFDATMTWEALSQYEQVVQALVAADTAAAEAAMLDHIRESRERLRRASERRQSGIQNIEEGARPQP